MAFDTTRREWYLQSFLEEGPRSPDTPDFTCIKNHKYHTDLTHIYRNNNLINIPLTHLGLAMVLQPRDNTAGDFLEAARVHAGVEGLVQGVQERAELRCEGEA